MEINSYSDHIVNNWKLFVEKLVEIPPGDPHTMFIEFDSQDEFIKAYGYMLMYISNHMFDKEPCDLNINEIGKILPYFHSMGINIKWDENDIIKLDNGGNKYNIYFEILKKK